MYMFKKKNHWWEAVVLKTQSGLGGRENPGNQLVGNSDLVLWLKEVLTESGWALQGQARKEQS